MNNDAIIDKEPHSGYEECHIIEELEVVVKLARINRKYSSGQVQNMFFLVE